MPTYLIPLLMLTMRLTECLTPTLHPLHPNQVSYRRLTVASQWGKSSALSQHTAAATVASQCSMSSAHLLQPLRPNSASHGVPWELVLSLFIDYQPDFHSQYMYHFFFAMLDACALS